MTMPSPYRLHGRRAFTLIELTMVLVIMGVLAAVLAPRYGDAIARSRVDAAAERLVAELALTSSRARAAGETWTVWMDPSTERIWRTSAASFVLYNTDIGLDFGAEPYRTDLSSVNFGGFSRIEFDAFGRPGSDGVVTLRHGQTQRIVTVTRATGAIEVGP
ncbi:MAG: type II secretion system protein [Planctomycetota bacterium]